MLKKNAGIPTITHDQAVDEALCYGWIDSTARSLNDDTFIQSFTRRRPKSVWSRISKERVARLIAGNLMTKAGCESIEIAKNNGYWSILDEVENLVIPPDLEDVFVKNPEAKAYFLDQSRSEKKRLLQWLVLAQRQETRQKRLNAIGQLRIEKK